MWVYLKTAGEKKCITFPFVPISCRRRGACTRRYARWRPPGCSRSATSPAASSASRSWCRSRSREGPRDGYDGGAAAVSRGAPATTPPTRATRNRCETICGSETRTICIINRTIKHIKQRALTRPPTQLSIFAPGRNRPTCDSRRFYQSRNKPNT